MMRHVSCRLGKKCPLSHLLTYFFIFGLLCPPVFGATNLLNNASFETEGTTNTAAYHWQWDTPDWHGSTWGSASRYSWRCYPTNEGSWSATICGEWAGAGTEGGWWQEVPTAPGREYEASAWFWADDGNPHGPWTAAVQGVKIEFLSGDVNGSNLLFSVTNVFDDVVQSWTQKTVTATAPVNADWVRFVVFAEGVSWAGSLQLDSAALYELEGSTNLFGTPAAVTVTSVVKNAQSLEFYWQPVTSDIQGRALAVSRYHVYSSDSPLFVPDQEGYSDLVYFGSDTGFTASNVFADASNRFYYITATDSSMVESLVFTDMVCKLSQAITCPPGTSVYTWINVPYDSSWESASNLAEGLDSITRVYGFDSTLQDYRVWDHSAATGTDFSLVAGDPVALELMTNTVIHVYGRYDKNMAYSWTHSTNRFNHHWVALPPQTILTTAQEMAWQIPACTKVARYDGTGSNFESYVKLGTNWLGTNFSLAAQEGVLVSISSNSDWQAPLPYPSVNVELDSCAGFISLSELVATSSVVSDEGALVEYAWDYDGNGVFDRTSSVPIAGFSTGFQSAVTWYPTLRVKNQRGFYGVGSTRYDALSMSLNFSNQAFRAGLGETGVISYASSTSGYFSVYIYDESDNLVRVVESNIWHASGAFEVGWDGRNNAAQLVSNGLYYAVIEQTLGTNSALYDPRQELAGSNITDRITGISLNNNFDPYSGGQFPITYDLTSPARVTILIKDQTNTTIAVVCSNALRAAGSNIDYWDGRLASGAMLAPGTVFDVSIEAVSVGENALVVVQPIPAIENLASSANTFTPSVNPYGRNTNTLTLAYSITAAADVRMAVRDQYGALIQSGLEPGKSAGANQTVWGGKNDSGKRVAAGVYGIALWCENGAGSGAPSTIWVEVYY